MIAALVGFDHCDEMLLGQRVHIKQFLFLVGPNQLFRTRTDLPASERADVYMADVTKPARARQFSELKRNGLVKLVIPDVWLIRP